MKVEVKKIDGQYVAAYPYNFQGFEFIYVKNENGKTLLFENRLAIHGIWLNDKQIADMVQSIISGDYKWNDNLKPLISVGDEIWVDSYKHRGIGIYKKDGFLKQTPDFDRSLKIVE